MPIAMCINMVAILIRSSMRGKYNTLYNIFLVDFDLVRASGYGTSQSVSDLFYI